MSGSPSATASKTSSSMGVYCFCFCLALPVLLLIAVAFGLLINGLHRLDSASVRISEVYLPDYQARHPLQNRVQILRRAVLSVRLSDNMELCRKALNDARAQLDPTFVDSTLSRTETRTLRRLLEELEFAKRTASRYKEECSFFMTRLERRVNRLSIVSGQVFSLVDMTSSPYAAADFAAEEQRFQNFLAGLQENVSVCNDADLRKTNLCRDIKREITGLDEAWQRHHQAQAVVYNLSEAIDFRLRDWFARFEAANSLALRKSMETMETERHHMELVISMAIIAISLASLFSFLIFLRKVIFPISLASQQLRQLEASGDCAALSPSRIRELDELFGMLPRLKTLIANMKAHSRNLAEECSEFRQMSFMDDLCGVPNRRSLDAALAQVEPTRPMAIFLLDVDYFKAYNDTLGHQKGDEALRMVAQTGARATEGYGTLYRYGGEEFCVLLLDAHVRHAAQVAEKVRCSVRELAIPHPANPPGILTVSIGVAVRNLGESVANTQLLRQADSLLYQAKGAGRDCVRIRL